MSEKSRFRVEDAYALRTPQDNVALYRDWAGTYEDGFVAENDYVFPRRLAEIYAARAEPSAPALDVGAGTGLVGRALRGLGVETVDGLDISPEMLAEAGRRGGYRRLIEADLTQPLPLADGAYGGLISAGTFTLGHVGPEALDELVRVAAPGALLALGVKREHWEGAGFAEALARLAAAGRLAPPETLEVRQYGPAATHEHKDDRAVVALARRKD